MAENEVYIETALDTRQLERGVADAKKQLAGLEKSYQRLQEKQRKFLQTGGQKQQLSSEYKAAMAETEKFGLALERALNKKEKLDETKANKNSQTYKQLEHEIDQLSKKFQQAEKAQEALEGTKYVDTSAWSKLQYDINNVNAQMKNAETELLSYEEQLERLKSKENSVTALRNGFARLKQSMKGMGKIMSKVADGLKKISHHSKKAHYGLAQMAKNAIFFGALFRAISLVSNGIKTGIQNLAQWNNGNNQTNRSLSMLKSSLTQLKNSLATAFTPILTVVAPILSKFVNMLSEAITYVGMFFARLTGQKTFVKAVGVTEDYAAGLDKTADSAKKAEKAMKGYLSPLDEINKLDKDKGSDSGNGGSGGGGISPNDMFQEVEIPDNVSDWVEKFKEAWETADFTEIGETVGTKLRDALDNINWEPIKESARKIGKSLGTFINGFISVEGLPEAVGNAIGEAINTVLTGLDTFLSVTHWYDLGAFVATGLNSTINKADFELLGKTVADFVKAGVNGWYGFVTTFDFSGLGEKIGSSVNAFFTDMGKVDKKTGLNGWETMGKDISKSITGIADTIIAALDTVKWESVGKAIGDFISGIEWGKVAFDMANLARAILTAIADGIIGFTESNPIAAAIAGTIIAIKVSGAELTALKELGTTMGTAIAGAAVAAVAGFEVGKKIGAAIFPDDADFYNNFSWFQEGGFFDSLGYFCGEMLPKWAKQTADFWKAWSNEKWQGLVDGWNNFKSRTVELVLEAKEKAKGTFDKLKAKWDSFKDKFPQLVANAKEKASGALATLRGKWDAIKSKTSTLTSKLVNKAGSKLEALKKLWDSFKSKAVTLTATFKDFFTSKIRDAWNGIRSGINSGISVINKIPGVNIKTIPALAQGAVIPANKEFMAILGDQKHGNNLEAPEGLIRKIVREESGKGTQTVNLHVDLDGRTVYQRVIEIGKADMMRANNNPFELA